MAMLVSCHSPQWQGSINKEILIPFGDISWKILSKSSESVDRASTEAALISWMD